MAHIARAGTTGEGVSTLLERMRGGDRGAAAEFVTGYGSRIRRRIRGKLSPAMRRIFDSQEILSTLGRRLDQFVRSGLMEASTEAELWALVFQIADNAIVDKARVFRRLQRVENGDGEFARALAARLRRAERRAVSGAETEIGRVLDLLPDPTDREILSLWLMDLGHGAIADVVGMSPAAVRQRWGRIRASLHARLAGHET